MANRRRHLLSVGKSRTPDWPAQPNRLARAGIAHFHSSTSQRIAYAFAASNGKTVLDTEPSGIATQEVCAIAHELKEFARASR